MRSLRLIVTYLRTEFNHKARKAEPASFRARRTGAWPPVCTARQEVFRVLPT